MDPSTVSRIVIRVSEALAQLAPSDDKEEWNHCTVSTIGKHQESRGSWVCEHHFKLPCSLSTWTSERISLSIVEPATRITFIHKNQVTSLTKSTENDFL
ncbi:hypothetical protein JTB14_036476 [Gonioctena quinquepunctata]|nr:hypothetical protein JTB14_036476 [Gonioctena quinquepunctata]